MRRLVTPFKTKLSRNTSLEFPTAHSNPLRRMCPNLHLNDQAKFAEAHLAQLISLNPTAKMLAVCDWQLFQRRLDVKANYCYALNRKLLPSMLPGNSIVSAVSKVLLEKCLAITARDNIVASNPYKDQETLELIKTHGISKVVVNTADEVEKIQMNNINADLIWQFDEVDPTESNLTLQLLHKYGIVLQSLKFLPAFLSNPTDILTILSQAQSHLHPIRNIHLSVPFGQQTKLAPLLKLLKDKSVVVELTGAESTSEVACAGRVIGKRNGLLCFNEVVDGFMAEEERLRLNKSSAEVGDWVGFTPRHVMGLEEATAGLLEAVEYSI